MKMYSALLGVIIAFAVGLVVGRYFNSGPSTQQTEQAANACAPAIDCSSAVRPGLACTSSASRKSSSETRCAPRPETATEPKLDSMRELIAQTTVDLPEAGTGRITGIVKLKDGAPLPGVTVRVKGHTSYYARWRNGEEPSLEEELTHVIKRKKFAKATTIETVTGTDGKFELSGAADIDYAIEARLDGYQIVARSPQVRPGAHIVLFAEPVVRLSVRMERIDGKPVTRGMLCQGHEAKKELRSGGVGWYPESPELRYPAGTYHFWGKDQSDMGVSSEVVTVTLEAGVTPAELVLVLKEWPGISGRLVFADEDEDNAWPEIAAVYFGDELPPATFDKDKVKGRPRQTCDCRSWDNWQYMFPECQPGNYLIYAMMGGSVVASAAVTVSDKLVRQDLNVAAPDRGDFIVVRGHDPENKLLDDLSFSIKHITQNGSHSSGGQAKRKSDGSYWVQKYRYGANENREDGGRWFIVVSSKSCGTKEVEFEFASRDDITVRFHKPAFIVASIPGTIDVAYKDRLTIAARKGGLTGTGASTPGTGSKPDSGQSRLGPFEPDRYVVQLLLSTEPGSGGMRGAMVVAEVEVTLTSGENLVSLAMPELYTLTVQLREAVKGQIVSLGKPGRGGRERRCNERGEVVFKDVLQGNYTLRLNYQEVMNIEVTRSATIDFEPQVMNAIKVRVSKPDCYAAIVGLQSDDLIIASNGVEFTDEDQMYRALYPRGAKKVKLTVARGLTKFDVEIEIEKFSKPDGGFECWTVSR